MAQPGAPAKDQGLAGEPLAAFIDEAAQKRICGGKILLRIHLATDEVAWVSEPAPLFRLAPRTAYLPFYFEDVYEHFKSYVPPLLGQTYEIWLDYDGVPLRWHYPVGVLSDVLAGATAPTPWNLTVHFRGCPSKDFLPFTGAGDLKAAVLGAFRQAAFLQQGSAQPWAKLPMPQQERLWDAIKAADLETYGAVRRLLLCPSLAKCRSLPIRLHISGTNQVLVHPVAAVEDGTDSAGADGGKVAAVTVGGFLRRVLPPVVIATQDDVVLAEGVEVISHGIHLPLDTPLYWLALNASYLDNFVHVVVRLPPSRQTSAVH